MISVAICGRPLTDLGYCDAAVTVTIEGIPVTVGLIGTTDPAFDPAAPDDRHCVLIRVRAFSCNYRDKGILLGLWREYRERSYFFIGSEFVGEVVETGSEVKTLQKGDRVIATRIPTNHASQRYLVLPEAMLTKVPPQVPDEVAAAFTINAQTAYSMLRKAGLRQGANVLVTSARSNASLFAINALQKWEANVYATTTAPGYEDRFRRMGVKELVQIDVACERFLDHERIAGIVSGTGGFDCVLDPYSDLHLGRVIETLAPYGRYVTCGFYDQYPAITGKAFQPPGADLSEILQIAITQNIQITGNNLGEAEDLTAAIADYVSGSLRVVIDSVFTAQHAGAFLDRTYNARDRFGKVVYQYPEAG